MKLYGYWRSTAAYRVRIALALKGIAYENISVHLVKDGGEQFKADYVELNSAKLVPILVDGEVVLNQSLAIIEYLDDKFGGELLLPAEPGAKAQVRALALDIACDIHPLNNLRILKYLKSGMGVSEDSKDQWYRHWILTGFAALEAKLAHTAGQYCFGDTVTMADLCLIPQLYNAHRFNVPLDDFPLIRAIEHQCSLLPAFISSAPENQPDAE